MDSDLAWVNGKSGRQSWRYADAFQRSIISEVIYHFLFFLRHFKLSKLLFCSHVLLLSQEHQFEAQQKDIEERAIHQAKEQFRQKKTLLEHQVAEQKEQVQNSTSAVFCVPLQFNSLCSNSPYWAGNQMAMHVMWGQCEVMPDCSVVWYAAASHIWIHWPMLFVGKLMEDI